MVETRAPGAVATLTIEPRWGIWRVTLDGAFYGEYAGKDRAITAAEEKAQALRLGGRDVRLLTTSSKGGAPSEQFFKAHAL